jgi:hypothetical protein
LSRGFSAIVVSQLSIQKFGKIQREELRRISRRNRQW